MPKFQDEKGKWSFKCGKCEKKLTRGEYVCINCETFDNEEAHMPLIPGQPVEYVMQAIVDSEEKDGWVYITTEVGRFYAPVGKILTFPEPQDFDRTLPEETKFVAGDGSC